MKHSKQMSESVRLGILLALSGGLMDAYSYIHRGEVFANAQTGNMLLFGVNLSEGNFRMAVKYLVPVLAFAIGIALAEYVHTRNIEKLHWRQMSVLLEAVILFGVGFMPESLNLLANSMTSFACGIQVESFRKIHGNGIATTMCIGNMRTGTQNLFNYFHDHDRDSLGKAGLYYGIIASFILGAIIGNGLIKWCGRQAIWCSSLLLFFGFFMMFIDYERARKK